MNGQPSGSVRPQAHSGAAHLAGVHLGIGGPVDTGLMPTRISAFVRGTRRRSANLAAKRDMLTTIGATISQATVRLG
jgi:hypothetical protein